MPDMAVLLDRELRRGAVAVEPENVEINLQKLTTEQISELAELIGDSTIRSAKAYRSARRQLERWRKGGVKLALRSQERLTSARSQANERIRLFRAHGAEMRIQVSWYGDRRPEWLPAGRWEHIRQSDTRQVVREWAEGHGAPAALKLFKAFLESYEVPNPTDWLRDAEVLDLRLEPGGMTE